MSKNVESTYKSNDTEEWLDIHFTRPIGFLWAKLFDHYNIHPNVVTILSIILGGLSGFMFYYPDMFHIIVGIILLVWANFYDSADGQLARMTGKKTLWGRILDGFAGDVWFFSIYFWICLRLQPEWSYWIWILAAISGLICHTKQCQLADYYRNVHLYFIKGKKGSEFDNYKKVYSDYKSLKWTKTLPEAAHKLFLFFYKDYTKSQEQMSPAFQKFYANVQLKFNEEIPASLRSDFREKSLPLMKYTNILTFNTRAIVLYVCLLIGYPWLYFAFEVTVMNVIWFYMRYKHEHNCKILDSQLNIYEA